MTWETIQYIVIAVSPFVLVVLLVKNVDQWDVPSLTELQHRFAVPMEEDKRKRTRCERGNWVTILLVFGSCFGFSYLAFLYSYRDFANFIWHPVVDVKVPFLAAVMVVVFSVPFIIYVFVPRVVWKDEWRFFTAYNLLTEQSHRNQPSNRYSKYMMKVIVGPSLMIAIVIFFFLLFFFPGKYVAISQVGLVEGHGWTLSPPEVIPWSEAEAYYVVRYNLSHSANTADKLAANPFPVLKFKAGKVWSARKIGVCNCAFGDIANQLASKLNMQPVMVNHIDDIPEID